MNMKSVSYILGWILNIEAVLMSLPLCTALIYREKQGFAFLAVMVICGVLGYVMWLVKHLREKKEEAK